MHFPRLTGGDYFHMTGGTAIGTTVSAIGKDLSSDPQHFAVTGLAPNAAISDIESPDSVTAFELFQMDAAKIGVKVAAVTAEGVDEAAFSGTVYIDADTAADGPDDDDCGYGLG